MTQSMLMKTKRSIKSVQTMLQLLVILSTMGLGMNSHAQTGSLTVTRTPSTMIAGQPFTIAWSSTEPTAVATKYSCVSPAGGFAGSATLSVSGTASGTADPNWLWKDSTCTWTVVNAAGSILASRTDIMKTVAAPVNGVTYIHTDGLGSPVAKSDANGNLIAGSRTRYEPYGMTVAGTATPTIGFTGHVNDADTGLTYMQQRYYDPVAGRFLSTDPVLTDQNTGASFNRYTYALNNPYKYIDPDGRQSWPINPNKDGKIVITSSFGLRNTGIKGASKDHPGLDFRARKGDEIKAPQNGTVSEISNKDKGGNSIFISNDDGSMNGFAHTKNIDDLKVGDKVTEGQTIGKSDGSGTTQAHLHFTYREGTSASPAKSADKPVDPMKTQYKDKPKSDTCKAGEKSC